MKERTIKVFAVASVLAFMCMAFACVGVHNGDSELSSVKKFIKGTSGGIDWYYDMSENVITISAAANPEEGYNAGVMKDYPNNDAPWCPTGVWGSWIEDGCKLTFDSGVTYIGANAFINCEKFKGDLILPDTVTKIGVFAFSHSGFDGKLSTNATDIGNDAFSYCVNLKEIYFTSRIIESIGYSAFNECTSLTTVSFEVVERIKNIPNDAFGNITFIYIDEGIPMFMYELRYIHEMFFEKVVKYMVAWS